MSRSHRAALALAFAILPPVNLTLTVTMLAASSCPPDEMTADTAATPFGTLPRSTRTRHRKSPRPPARPAPDPCVETESGLRSSPSVPLAHLRPPRRATRHGQSPAASAVTQGERLRVTCAHPSGATASTGRWCCDPMDGPPTSPSRPSPPRDVHLRFPPLRRGSYFNHSHAAAVASSPRPYDGSLISGPPSTPPSTPLGYRTMPSSAAGSGFNREVHLPGCRWRAPPDYFTIKGRYPEPETIPCASGTTAGAVHRHPHTTVHPIHIHCGLSSSSKPTLTPSHPRANPRTRQR